MSSLLLAALVFGVPLMWLLGIADSNLILRPTKLVVFEGGDAIFACSPFFPIEPPILIQQNSVILTTRSEPRLRYKDFVTSSSSSSNRTFTLREVVREDDRTKFRCVIGDSMSNEITLHVYVLPQLRGPSGRVYIQEGYLITRYFHYEDPLGLPPVHSFVWYRDGILFHGNSHVMLLEMNSTLAVQNATRNDSGNYTLTITSTAGQASLTLNLLVIYDEFTEAPKSLAVAAGAVTSFRCRHRFGWAYAWTTNRGPISDLGSKARISANNRVIYYGPVSESDHLLVFTCIAHSVDRINFFVSPPATLSVRSIPQVTSPREISTVENRNSEVLLLFHINSFPPPLMQLYEFRGKILHLNARVSALSNGSLLIKNPTRTDAGHYHLHISNTLGNASATIQLTVFYAPEIQVPDSPFITQINRTANISCGSEVVGNPFPSFQWSYQEERTGPFPERITVDPESGELIVSRVEHVDSDIYVCTATNSISNSSISVQLLVLDPPGPPMNPVVRQVGNTWALVSWTPPTNKGSIGSISKYAVSGLPKPTNYGNATEMNAMRGRFEDERHQRNTACVEFECETRYEEVLSNMTVLNLTGLVPAINYTLVIFAFSNGSNLQSGPSQQLHFITKVHVPGIGSVTSVVHGPGSAAIMWTLAFSGGLPVSQFHVEYQRNDTSIWREAQIRRDEGGRCTNCSVISSDLRFLVVHSLEAEEYYNFRVAGSNCLGMGEYRESDVPLLSHTLGVPSPPSRPRFIRWNQTSVTIGTTISKLGSELNFTLNLILLLNGVEVTTSHAMDLPDNYTIGDEVELTLTNISYRGGWRFMSFLTNHLGSSLLSEPSLQARESIQQTNITLNQVGIALWTLMGIANAITMVIATVVCGIMKWESNKQKKSFTRRMEIARDQTDCPFSPRSILTFGDFRDSPDERSNHVPTTPGGSITMDYRKPESINLSPLDSV